MAGVLVSYRGGEVVVVLGLVLAAGDGGLAGFDPTSRRWFLASALFVGMSQLFRYLALAVAPVSVVVPIQRLSVVFRIVFNALINRDHEVLDRWVIVSILLAAVGAAALAGDTGTMLRWMGIGEATVEILSRPLV